MASKKTLTAANLAELGAERLAALLIELADGKADVKRRLRLEILGDAAGDLIAAEIGKRLNAIERAQSAIDWRKAKDFSRDLDVQRAMIVSHVAPTEPKIALELMWRFIGMMEHVLRRMPDGGGGVIASFRQACVDIGAIAPLAMVEAKSLAERVYAVVRADRHGLCMDLIDILAPALGREGLALLRGHFQRAIAALDTAKGSASWTSRYLFWALRAIADAEGDVDAFKAGVPAEVQLRYAPAVARRLVAAGRAAEAVRHLEEAEAQPHKSFITFVGDVLVGKQEPSFEEAMIAALDASGAQERAQALRLRAFQERLAVEPLRAYLKRLPDFDDMEAEEKALDQVAGHRNMMQALEFFRLWPAPARLARLVEARYKSIDGNDFERLGAAVPVLAEKYPLAATLVLRAMILDTLEGSKSLRYKYGGRHLRACTNLAAEIADWGAYDSHETFLTSLKKLHGRKYGFWAEVDATQ
jgi:hypothetical protein